MLRPPIEGRQCGWERPSTAPSCSGALDLKGLPAALYTWNASKDSRQPVPRRSHERVRDLRRRDPRHGALPGLYAGVKPALEAAGARYLARGGAHKIYEGDWTPRRIVILEFTSVAAWEASYYGDTYRGLKSIRDECSSARLVLVEGLE